jgi:hypothetical protein
MPKINPANRPILSVFRKSEFEALDKWRRTQPSIPNLSDSVRILTRLGLQAVDGAGAKATPASHLSKRPSIKESTTTTA